VMCGDGLGGDVDCVFDGLMGKIVLIMVHILHIPT